MMMNFIKCTKYDEEKKMQQEEASIQIVETKNKKIIINIKITIYN